VTRFRPGFEAFFLAGSPPVSVSGTGWLSSCAMHGHFATFSLDFTVLCTWNWNTLQSYC
jgi:hypothetical protein